MEKSEGDEKREGLVVEMKRKNPVSDGEITSAMRSVAIEKGREFILILGVFLAIFLEQHILISSILLYAMQSGYYIDSCIWRDYFDDRSDKFRPLGEWAFRLINKIIKENNVFLFSDQIMRELKQHYSVEKLNGFFEIIPSSLIICVESNRKQAKEALLLAKEFDIPFGDAIHAVIARDNNAILVTRDHHFENLTKIVAVRKPEELI